MKTAFMQYLINNNQGNREGIADDLFKTLMENPKSDNMVWDILGKVSEGRNITDQTFSNAADYILSL